MESATLILQ